MCQFIETIKIENGQPKNLLFHQKRLDSTRKHFFINPKPISLKTAIKFPENLPANKIYKCKIVYGQNIESISFTPYTLKNIQSLQIVRVTNLDYSYKYKDRSKLELFFESRGDADEVLFVQSGYITDISYANTVLFHPEKGWITPEHYLLNGIQRQKLLEEGKIITQPIRVEDLNQYHYLSLINAMVGLGEGPQIKIDHIK